MSDVSDEKKKVSFRINLFETSLGGHRPRYLREIICGLKEHLHDCDLRLCIFESHRKDPGYMEFLHPLEDQFCFCRLENRNPQGRFRSEMTRLRLLSDCVRRYPCDRAIIPYGDGLVPLMGMLPRWLIRQLFPENVQFESIVFRPEWAYPTTSRWHRWYHVLRRYGTRRWPGWRLHLSDRNAFNEANRSPEQFSARISLIPEVFEEWTTLPKDQALAWLLSHGYLKEAPGGIDYFSDIISPPGSLSNRKGVAELIEAFVADRGRKAILLLWEVVPLEVQQVLDRRSVSWRGDPRIVVVDRYVNEEAFRALFSVSDLIVLPYQFNLGGVSSIYLLSAIHRKKTLCDDRAWLGWASKTYQHGLAMNSTEPSTIAYHLGRILEGATVTIASEKVAAELRSECMTGGFRKCWAVE